LYCRSCRFAWGKSAANGFLKGTVSAVCGGEKPPNKKARLRCAESGQYQTRKEKRLTVACRKSALNGATAGRLGVMRLF